MEKFLLLLVVVAFIDLSIAVCPSNVSAPCFAQSDFDVAFLKASIDYNVTEELLLNSLNVSGVTLDPSDPTYGHFARRNTSQFAIDQNRFTTIAIVAIQKLKADWNLTKAQLRTCMRGIHAKNDCTPVTVTCIVSNTTYYRPDGQCNNAANPHFGAIYRPMMRLLADGFEDGYESMSSPRTLETSRTDSVSGNTHHGFNDNLQTETPSDMSTMAFQILTHELMMTKKSQLTASGDGGGFDCRNTKNDPLIATLIRSNKYCMPIDVKFDDTCYANKTRSLNYIRSFRAFDQCNLAEAPSMVNFHTPYFDCEIIYNEHTLQHLSENGGLFAFENDTKMIEIFVGYDHRSNQLPGLLLYLSMYVRLHNSIVNGFLKEKPTMRRGSAAFEARRITCGVYQKIFVDLIQSIMDFSVPSPRCYNASINPQVSVEFNVALRVMHYFIRDKMMLFDRSNFLVPSGIRGVKPVSFDQSVLIDNTTFYENNKCGLTHGLLDTSWNMAGLGPQTQCAFFAKHSHHVGTDLRAFDYQFGREIGEPSYASFLQAFQGAKQACDKDIPQSSYERFDSKAMDFLLKRYQNKLWEMGLSKALDLEKRDHVLGLGAEFFVREQMTRSICGDRFWFNHNNGIFTASQREKIRSFDFQQLLCLVNNCNGTRIQTFPFSSPGPNNRKSLCLSPEDLVSNFDLKNW